MKPITLEDEYSYPLHMSGQATSLPIEPPRDYGAELRAVFKEVTGQDIPAPERARIGFLP